MPNSYIGKSPDQIANEDVGFDSAGYLFRALSWLDVYRRQKGFPAILYASIEGRMAIEYLLFEILVVGTGADLSFEEYAKCLKERSKLDKAINRLVPDYEKIQAFTGVLIKFEAGLPNQISWNVGELKKQWGKLSEILHWNGARNLTTESIEWNDLAFTTIEDVLNDVRSKMETGASMAMAPSSMKPEIFDVWNDYKLGSIDLESVRFRLNLLRPVLHAKYA